MKTKLLKSLLTIACLLCSIGVYAHDFEVDGIYYQITAENEVAVTYYGDDYSNVPAENMYTGSVVIPSSVTYNDVEFTVTSIGRYAFRSCSGLTSVNISNSVTSIGGSAFSGCSGLTSVNIPNSVTSIDQSAFSSCSGLTSVNIPNSVTSIGRSAFSGCSGLTSVDIPNSVTSIDQYAFYGCSGLTEITIPESVSSIGMNAFEGCSALTSVNIPNSVTSIGGSAFRSCSGLTSVNIPNSLTSIGGAAFYGCSGLTSVNIPNSVTSIGGSAFYGCSGLTSVNIPNSVTSIKDETFYACSALTEITIPESVTSIGSYAFYNCYDLISVTILATVPPVIESYSFTYSDMITFVPSGCGATYRAAEYWKNCNIIDTNPAYAVEVTVSKPGLLAVDIDNKGVALKNVTELIVHGKINPTDISVMRNNMTSCYSIDLSDAECDEIPADAFKSKITLKKIVLPPLCKVIGNNAFKDCVLLSDSIAFPDGLISIGNYAFSGCKTIKQTVVLPNSVTSIGNNAFEDCNKIKSITLPENLTTIGSYTFADCAQLSNVSFPVTIETIGNSAFSGCKNMTLVDLSGCEKLSSIGDYAFNWCENITTLNLPASLQAVGSSAFANCKKLANISVYATTPPEAGDRIFSNVDNYSCLLSYPTASHVDYLISAHWGAFIETRKSIDVEVEDADCNDCKEGHGCKRHHRGGHIWYDRDWHKHHPGHHGPRRAAAENEEIVEISGIDATIGDGLSLRVPTDSVVTFLIEPREGYSIGSVHYGEEDVTNQVVNGVFTTDAVNENAVLKVSFVNESGEAEPDDILAGDANDDKLVNISDAVVTMNYILGETESMKRVDNADMNNDGIINVGDVVGIVNTILGDEGTSAPAYYQGNKGKLQVSDIVVGGDENTPIEIVLDNNMPYTSFQMDVILPAGLKAQGVTLGNRLASTHHVMWKEQADGSLRIAAFAIDNAAIADNTGVLLAIDVVAENRFKNGVVEINNAVFATRNITIHNLDNSSCNVNNTTDVKRIYTIDRIYSAGDAIVVESTCNRVAYITTTSGVTRSVELQAGRNEISMLQQGVYIVVIGDTAHKVVIK